MIRVLSLNLQRGLDQHGRTTTADQLAAAVADLDVDVVALQEVDRGQPRTGGIDQGRVVADALGLPHLRFVATLAGDVRKARAAPTRWGKVDGAAYGLAVASRWPVAAWFTRPVPRLRPRYPVLTHGTVTLRADEQRGVLATVLRTPGGPLAVCSAHLSTLGPVAAFQVRSVLRSAAALPSPTVVAGDLNLDPWLVRPLARGWQQPHAPTFPASAPRRQIDHALVRGARVVAVEALRLPISDHRGLLVTLASA